MTATTTEKLASAFNYAWNINEFQKSIEWDINMANRAAERGEDERAASFRNYAEYDRIREQDMDDAAKEYVFWFEAEDGTWAHIFWNDVHQCWMLWADGGNGRIEYLNSNHNSFADAYVRLMGAKSLRSFIESKDMPRFRPLNVVRAKDFWHKA